MMPKVYNKRDPNVPPDAVYVGRPSVFGNPFVIGKDGNRKAVLERYRDYLSSRLQNDAEFAKAVLALRGRDLVCYCKPKACHGDMLLVVANGDIS